VRALSPAVTARLAALSTDVGSRKRPNRPLGEK
jgi:hypothetical protein